MEKIIFSENEKLYLVQLVTDEKDIIENKRIDGPTLKLKNEAWERITTLYNSQAFSQRSVKQLKKCWENIKQRKRRLITSRKQEQLKGGRLVPDDPLINFVDVAATSLDVESSSSWDEAKEMILDTPSTSAVGPTSPRSHADESGPSTPCLKKIKLELDECDEPNLKVKKLQESIAQQRELHKLRMKTARMEYTLAILKVKEQLRTMGRELNVEEIDWDNFNLKDLL